MEAGEGEGCTSFLSINAVTLDHNQSGLDLREWLERKWIAYVDSKDYKGGRTYDRPHEGGTY